MSANTEVMFIDIACSSKVGNLATGAQLKVLLPQTLSELLNYGQIPNHGHVWQHVAIPRGRQLLIMVYEDTTWLAGAALQGEGVWGVTPAQGSQAGKIFIRYEFQLATKQTKSVNVCS